MASPLSAIASWFRKAAPPVASSAPSTSPAPAATDTVGAHGFQVTGGYLRSDERHPDLIGTRKWRTYADTVANNPTAAAAVRYRLDLSARPNWNVDPADGSPEAQEAADYVRDVMHDMARSWKSAVRRHHMTWIVGFALSEITVKVRSDGHFGIASLDARPQATIEKWDVDANGDVLGVWQRSPQDQRLIYLPRSKLVYTVDDSLTDSPDGMGLLRHVVESVRRLLAYEKLEGQGYETDLRGMPMVFGPWSLMAEQAKRDPDAAAASAAALAQFQTFIAGGHQAGKERGIIMDSATYPDQQGNPTSIAQWRMETARGDAAAAIGVNTAIDREARGVARVFGTEGMMLTGGSLALARDKTIQLALAIDACNRAEAAQFQRDIFERVLWPLERRDPALMPTLTPEPVQVGDVDQIASALSLLSQAGAPITPGDAGALAGVNAVLSMLGLPQRDGVAGGVAGAMLPPAPSFLKDPPVLDNTPSLDIAPPAGAGG